MAPGVANLSEGANFPRLRAEVRAITMHGKQGAS